MKNGQLVTFELSLPSTSSEVLTFCPNCGFRVHTPATSLITKESFSKTIIILGCGTFLYFHFYRHDELRAFLEDVGRKLQNCSTSIFRFFYSPTQPKNPTNNNNNNDIPKFYTPSQAKYSLNIAKLVNDQHNTKPFHSPPIIDLSTNQQISTCQVTNQIFYVDKKTDKSPVKEKVIENTVSKIDSLLEQVKELKETVQEFSITDLTFERSPSFRMERRASENDLPSLEWDLEEFLQNEESYDELSQVFQAPFDELNPEAERPFINLFNLNYNGIDADTLSKIVFNKNFDFKERICNRRSEGDNEQIHESLAQIRQRLLRNQILYRTLRRNNPQMNALMEPPPYRLYKSCLRDSAYFED